MTQWFRSSEGALHRWVEVDEGGLVLREALFDERVRPPDLLPPSRPVPWGAAVVAASRPELARVTWRFGTLGARIYHRIYGRITARTRPAATVSDVEPVSRSDFAVVWGRARSDRQCTRRLDGPLPDGTRVTGTVEAVPWGPGVTGLFVRPAPEVPFQAFVDMGALPGVPEQWPAVGTAGEFEVLDVRIDAEFERMPNIQVRLRPTAPLPPAVP
ncbi:hypothetical protein ACIBL6_24465 [Streptomyces sp. NPDC050400]|uniref:hypothetical protein n=1 Tax=Streptomyces sp. NPDC050400 TaxID=3365610 RepID=UPI0037A786BC